MSTLACPLVLFNSFLLHLRNVVPESDCLAPRGPNGRERERVLSLVPARTLHRQILLLLLQDSLPLLLSLPLVQGPKVHLVIGSYT